MSHIHPTELPMITSGVGSDVRFMPSPFGASPGGCESANGGTLMTACFIEHSRFDRRGKQMANHKSIRLGFFLIFSTVLITLSASYALAQAPENLDQIRAAIAAKGAKWHADETSVSKLSHEEKKMRLGLLEGISAGATASTTTDQAVTTAPATLDWRNVNGVSFVSPVKNQGACGSCWAFAVTAALESQVMIATSGQPRDLSEQILVSCSGAGSCSGGYPSSASTFIRDIGLPVEGCFPYTATDTSCGNACINWKAGTDMVSGWHSVSSSVDSMKSAVYNNGPVVATFYVYNDFYSYRSGVYSYATGAYIGAHAVLVVGYDDATGSFLVKNSWGSTWGESGYFHIAYSEVTGTSRFGYSVLAYDGYKGIPVPDNTPPTASVSSPVNGATLSGTATITVSAADNVGVTSVDLYLNTLFLGTDTSSPFSFAWNTTSVTNGAYTLKAVAHDSAGNSGESASIGINVNNIPDTTPPAVWISSPANGSTVSKVVKINVKATDNVKVQRIDVLVDSKQVGTIACSAASCSGTVNWNANSAAKGTHTIQGVAYDAVGNKTSTGVTATK
jgi:C1A family cysteine protease